jgi:hypothetical protein
MHPNIGKSNLKAQMKQSSFRGHVSPAERLSQQEERRQHSRPPNIP